MHMDCDCAPALKTTCGNAIGALLLDHPMQTTNKVFNDEVFEELNPHTVLSWQRVRTANWLAASGEVGVWGGSLAGCSILLIYMRLLHSIRTR